MSVLYWYGICSAPEAGEYGLEVYVNDPDVDGSSLYLVCQYMIVCNELIGRCTPRSLPNVPPGFLGPQPNFHKFGLACTSHDDPYVTATSGELEVSQLHAVILLLQFYMQSQA